jgi:small subunit ribosomal protein S4
MGFGSTRAEARQLISHKAILVNGKALNIPSAQIRLGDVVAVREKSRTQARIQDSLNLAEQTGFPAWVSVDKTKMQGTFRQIPERSEIAADINESLVVELYSR